MRAGTVGVGLKASGRSIWYSEDGEFVGREIIADCMLRGTLPPFYRRKMGL